MWEERESHLTYESDKFLQFKIELMSKYKFKNEVQIFKRQPLFLKKGMPIIFNLTEYQILPTEEHLC